VKNSVNF